jgi:carbonic anhydrase/acetyltransferase-like protein (isoleucine patch superfamily)
MNESTVSTGVNAGPKGLVLPYNGTLPTLGKNVFLAPGTFVMGDAVLGDNVNIWFGTVIRGDDNYIRIGARTNIQDNSTIHVSDGTGPTVIGADVLVGHGCILHGCTIEDGAFIGMGSTVLDGAVVESGAMVAAGTLVTPGKRVKKGELWAGNPCKLFRPLKPAEIEHIPWAVKHYVERAAEYLKAGIGVV